MMLPLLGSVSCSGCAAIFFGACLPTAGCAAAEQMISCVNALMLLDCPDMSVCGNDCTLDDGDPVSNVKTPSRFTCRWAVPRCPA